MQNGPNAIYFRFPKLHSFPPFFTLQPNELARARQLEAWLEIVRDYCRSIKCVLLNPCAVRTASGTAIKSAEKESEASAVATALFTNKDIQRKAEPELIAAIVRAGLVDGTFERVTKNSETLFVFWRSLAEWAPVVLDTADKLGVRQSIATLFELRNELGVTEPALMKRILEYMEKCRPQMVVLIDADGPVESIGVKFAN